MTFRIGDREIGGNHPPLVIAEIGINHGGCIKVAKKMVVAAKEAGAEVVKFQCHVIDDEMSFHAKDILPGNSDQTIYQIMHSSALSEPEEIELKRFTEELGLIYLSTPFSRAAADRLERMNVVAFKIGSGECNNYPLVRHVAQFGKPVVLSTGMNTIEDVAISVKIFEEFKTPYALLHCTNIYPTPPKAVRLPAITQMKQAFPGAVVGLSDHTTSNHACLAAVTLGAEILERHFTDTMERVGPDIVCSMDPSALKELITGSADIKEMMDNSPKGLHIEERVTANFAYASVVSTQTIDAGDKLSKENIWVKRPGTGDFLAKDYEKLIGCIAKRTIPADHQISDSDISGYNDNDAT